MANKLNHIANQESLVDFAFRIYSEPKVEELCLHLQNQYNANVNILLWTCWLQVQGIKLSVKCLDEVLISIDSPSQLIVGRLQEIRRTTKTSLGLTKTQEKLINKHILKAELTAEKIFLQRLQDMTSRFEESQRLPIKESREGLLSEPEQGCAGDSLCRNNPESEHFLRPNDYLEYRQIPYADERAAALMSYAHKVDIVS